MKSFAIVSFIDYYLWIHNQRRKRLYLLLIAKYPIVHAVYGANFDYTVQLFGQLSPLENE